MARSKSGGHPGGFPRIHAIEGDVVLIDNPRWGDKPIPKNPTFCHDGSPYLEIPCGECGAPNHTHLGQIEGVPDDVEVAMRCSKCREPFIVTARFLRHAIEKAWAT